ncbi:MAG TPA: class II fumarate hydratase [Polyangia bacterium]|jgi:fumarate hydratase class II|nr:class II fumarate hydratase [Polyangia bacterium]
MTDELRTEKDSLGEVAVPADALFGAQTQRAATNFPVSGLRLPRPIIRSLGLIKKAAAELNKDAGHLPPAIADAIVTAALEVAAGQHDDQFVVDIFQTGSGTSSNMNANEVIANRAIQILGGRIGSKTPVHPNDHVNKGQSSNDVFPSAVHIAAVEAVERDLLPALRALEGALDSKARAFDHIVKIGRTHLMDAVPIRLGQEFSGYAAMLTSSIRRVESVCGALCQLALGGTAVGTGLGADPAFARRIIGVIGREVALPLRQAPNLFEALATHDGLVEASGALRATAVSLTKIANDVRWLGSGPRCGIGELHLPDLQPGSSIMPGKVNPVMAEMLLQACAQVIGNDATIAWGGAAGNFELNVMTPVMAYNFLQSTEILANGCRLFAARCIEGIEPNEDRCTSLVEQSLAMVTALVPRIGYDAAAAIAQESVKTGKTVRQICMEKNVLPADELTRLLDPLSMTGR